MTGPFRSDESAAVPRFAPTGTAPQEAQADPNEDMERIKSPGPYAKAFREKFPVPEFPGIKNRQEDQA